MAFPPGIPTRVVSVGGATVLESAALLKIQVAITSSRSLIRDDTGYRFESSAVAVLSGLGTEVSIVLPRTDVAGWRDAATGALIDVSAENAYTHQYTAQIRFLGENDSVVGNQYTLGPFVLPDGDGPIDLDKTVPASSVAGGQVNIPDMWGQLVAEAQAAALAAQAVIPSTDAAVNAALTEPGSVTKATLDAQIVSVANASVGRVLTTIPDMANSWWQNEDAMYEPTTKRLSVGGISRGGAMNMGVSDLSLGVSEKFKLTDERFLLDDHCGVGMAFDFSLNRRPILAFSRHDRSEPDGSNCLYVRESDSYTSFDNLGPEQRLSFGVGGNDPVAYGGVLAKPTVANKRVVTTNGNAVLTNVNASAVPLAHALVNGMRFRFTVAGAPAPFAVGVSYYVVNSTADTTQFGLAATPGGAAIVPTVTSSDGSLLITDVGRGLVYCRAGGGTQIWAARSHDLMVSVTDRPTAIPPTFDDSTAERFRLIDKAYIDITRAGNTFWAVATSDPTPSGDPSAAVTTYFLKGTVADAGTMRNAAGANIGSLWGAAPAPGSALVSLTPGSGADLIYTASGNDGVRWYDIARGGDAIVALRFDRRDFDVNDAGAPNQSGRNPKNGGTYAVYRRIGSAAANTWVWEPIGPSGEPFGAYKSVYVGGPAFERDDANANALIAVVESGGIWSVRRYVRTGAAYTAGTWTEDAVLYTAPAGSKLGRPRIPSGSEGLAAGKRIFTVSEYPFYSILNFTDFHSMQKVVQY